MIRRFLKNKKGSYLLEAALTLPVFLIAIITMSSVILIYACIEDCSFIAANELRRGAAEAVFGDTSLMIPHRIKKELIDDHSRVDTVRVTDYGYRVSRWGKDELIACTFRMRLRSPDQIGIRAAADYDLSLVTRAFVGRIRNAENMTADELRGGESDPVYIFPKRGERYHARGCTFLKAAATSGALSHSLRSKYSSCPLCKSKKASDGALVYYFPEAGEDYHLPGCSALQRNYIEIDKKDAIQRGYTPCSKCGG